MQFRTKESRPGSSRSLSKQITTISEPSTIQLPPARNEIPKTSYDSVATPMPNLLESLGHSTLVSSPTPPLTPTLPGGEELFFRIPNSHGLALGSPSDPSSAPRRVMSRGVRPKATPFLPVDMGSAGSGKLMDNGYFDIPVSSATTERPGWRRSSASGASTCSMEQENWTIEKTDFGNGGLKNAVEASTDPSEKVYVGTLGHGTDDLDESTKVAIEGHLREDDNCLIAFTSNADFDGHYNHYCKEVCFAPFKPYTTVTDIELRYCGLFFTI